MISNISFLVKRFNKSIEKSGTGIEKSGIRIDFAAFLVLLIGSLLWSSMAVAIQGSETGTSSVGGEILSPTLAINEDLVTINFRDEYRVIAGYGYIEQGFSQISLYSLEYVDVINGEGSSGQENIFVQGSEAGHTSEETAPIQGSETGGASENATSNQQLKAWGIAEVVLSERGIADIIVYRLDDEGVLEEVGVYSGVEVH